MAISHAHFARECADRESSLSQETRHFLHERAIGERSIHCRSIGGLADAPSTGAIVSVVLSTNTQQQRSGRIYAPHTAFEDARA
jgi:hypothetical protein